TIRATRKKKHFGKNTLPNNSPNMKLGSKPDPNHLVELANYKMPFGKYEGWYLANIPEYYFVWFKQKGFPEGKLGRMMGEMYELKLNGLEGLVQKLIKK